MCLRESTVWPNQQTLQRGEWAQQVEKSSVMLRCVLGILLWPTEARSCQCFCKMTARPSEGVAQRPDSMCSSRARFIPRPGNTGSSYRKATSVSHSNVLLSGQPGHYDLLLKSWFLNKFPWGYFFKENLVYPRFSAGNTFSVSLSLSPPSPAPFPPHSPCLFPSPCFLPPFPPSWMLAERFILSCTWFQEKFLCL